MADANRPALLDYLRTYSKAGMHTRRKPVKKPITVTRILPEKQMASVIHKVMDVLLDWRASPFEFEGAAIAGLRAHLCMKGYPWHDSNTEALSIVAEALRKMGVERPTWDQGQREYTVPAENCKTCGGDMPPDAHDGRRNHFYCSDICAKIAFEHRSYENGWRNDKAGMAAWRVLRRAKNRQRICKHCHSTFRPLEENDSTIFCSPKCNSESQRTIPDRTCEGCDTTFRPKDSNRIHCSRACFLRYHAERERTCEHCGSTFKSPALGAKHCSSSCKHKAFRTRKKHSGNVIYLTADVFDEWFREAA